MTEHNNNVDTQVAAGFGREWSVFTQGKDLSSEDRLKIFQDYFGIFPWERLPLHPVGIDVGCGSGRWASLVASRVGHLHLLDASEDALEVAKFNLLGVQNVSFHWASVGNIPITDRSLDFAYSLGVLHHVPDTPAAIMSIASKLKPGAPLLIYLYYALDNRPAWFRALWIASDSLRRIISKFPPWLKLFTSQTIAIFVYWPLARLAKLCCLSGIRTNSLPLEFYKDKGLYVMKTDSYDRFCTSLEQRFSRQQIETMLMQAGFERVTFSASQPFWCADGFKK